MNRIACPGLGLEDFLRLVRSAGLAKVELRNDLPELEQELAKLARAARGIRCPALVFCPHNDRSDHRDQKQRYREALAALKRFGPILADTGLLAYVEPLGFPISSLAHHFLGPDSRESLKGRPVLQRIGLVHISGVQQEVPGASSPSPRRRGPCRRKSWSRRCGPACGRSGLTP
jgi:2-keto-myo-inositol isomerase